MSSASEILIKQLLKNLEYEQQRYKFTEKQLEAIKSEIAYISESKRFSNAQLDRIGQIYDFVANPNKTIEDFNKTFTPQKRVPKSSNITYKQVLKDELDFYISSSIIDSSTISKIVNSPEPQAVWDILNTDVEQGGYKILLDWVQWYGKYIGGDSPEEREQTANIIEKMEDIFESFVNRLENEGLLG